jgi:hypothetical protein
MPFLVIEMLGPFVKLRLCEPRHDVVSIHVRRPNLTDLYTAIACFYNKAMPNDQKLPLLLDSAFTTLKFIPRVRCCIFSIKPLGHDVPVRRHMTTQPP